MVQEVGTIASTEDLLIQILLRVPARPLVRFKCVSKHWLSLISDPKFCHRHTLQNPNSSISAVFPRTSAYIALSFIPLDLDHDLRSSHGNQNLSGSPNCNPLNFVQNHEIMIIQSCNGLFLCCPLAKRSKPPYYVLNPTTNQFSTLNPPAAAATSGQPCLILGQALAFDPSKSPHYKVLFLCRENYYSDFHIEIYSSETQSWRLVDSSFNMARQGVRYDEGLYCNGAVHWVGLHKELSYYHIDDERVRHVFEPDRHVFSLGLEPFEWFEFRFLQESHCGGHLHLIDIYSSRIEVSEMGRDYSGWCLKYHVDLNPMFTTFRPREKKFSVLFLTPEEIEGDESSSLLLHIPGKIISYNLKSKIFKAFQLTPRRGVNDCRRRVQENNFRYMETLAPV